MKKLLGLVVVVVVVAIIAYTRMQPDPLSLAVSPASRETVRETVANTRAGTIKACRRSKLSMPMGGVVDRLLVKKGDPVQAGDLLLELWNRDHHAGVEQAMAALDSARHSRQQMCTLADRSAREASRASTLLKQQLIAADQADNLQSQARAQGDACESAKAQVTSAQASLDMQKAVLERFQLRAPFAGVVAEINGEIGEYVTPSPPGVQTPPAVDLIDTSCLYATAPIDEVDAAALRLGMPVTVTLDAFRDREFRGTLTRIAPYVLDLEKQARTVDVDVKLDTVPEDVVLLIGYSADVSILLREKADALAIPTEALLEGNAVWVIATPDAKGIGRLQKRQVTTGLANYEMTEILSGIDEGEWIVRSPDLAGLEEGAPARANDETTGTDNAGS